MTDVLDGQVSLCDLGIWSGKMSPEPSAPTTEKISRPSSKKSSKSQNPPLPVCLCLKKGDGAKPDASTMSWESGVWPGECMMHSSTELLNGEKEYRYWLTSEDLQRRGLCLNPWDIQSKRVIDPNGVADALYSGERRYGGGEAYVMDKPDTICLEGNGSRESHFGNGYSESDVMYTLNTIEQHGVLPVAVDVYNQTIDGDVAATLTAEVGVPNHSGPKVMASGIVSKGNGEAWLMEEKTTSVTSGGGQAGQGYPAALVSEEPIVLESNQNHATVTDDGISPTLPASMGMGGGYVPMVADRHAISFQERAGKPGGGKGILIQDEHTGALSTLNIQHVLSLETYHCESETDTAMTLKARDYKDPQSVYCVQRGEDDG